MVMQVEVEGQRILKARSKYLSSRRQAGAQTEEEGEALRWPEANAREGTWRRKSGRIGKEGMERVREETRMEWRQGRERGREGGKEGGREGRREGEEAYKATFTMHSIQTL